MRKMFLPLLCLLPCALLCSCTSAQGGNNSTPSTEEAQYQTVERDGKTAVLLEDAVLTDSYAALSDENGQRTWTDLSQDTPLKKGDVVLILKENETTAQVYVPTGDAPESLYGQVPAKVLSQNEADLQKGNLASVSEQMTYDTIDGQEAGVFSGMVEIVSREADWFQVRALSGGDPQLVWVPASSVSFNLDATVHDREPQ